jgi:hypothetical protein
MTEPINGPAFFKPLSKDQESQLFAGIRAQRKRLLDRGGRRCHCGGLVFPTPTGERHTCTHGEKPALSVAEIDAIWTRWDAEDRGRAVSEASGGNLTVPFPEYWASMRQLVIDEIRKRADLLDDPSDDPVDRDIDFSIELKSAADDLELLAKLRAHPDFNLGIVAIARQLPSKSEAVQLLLQLLRGGRMAERVRRSK